MEIQSYILYEDRDLIVCRKPAGVPVQTKQIQTKDMVSLMKNYRYQQEGGKGEPYLGVIHRLDQPVEGIIVFAKTPQAAKELNRQLLAGGFGKYYQAVLCKVPEKAQGQLTDYLVKDGRTNLSKICRKSDAGAKEARLSYKVQGEAEGKALANIHLDTKGTGKHSSGHRKTSSDPCADVGDGMSDSRRCKIRRRGKSKRADCSVCKQSYFCASKDKKADAV